MTTETSWSDNEFQAEYDAYVQSMVQHCQCLPLEHRPCDGVLAGGLCDRLGHYDKTDDGMWVGYDDQEDDEHE